MGGDDTVTGCRHKSSEEFGGEEEEGGRAKAEQRRACGWQV